MASTRRVGAHQYIGTESDLPALPAGDQPFPMPDGDGPAPLHLGSGGVPASEDAGDDGGAAQPGENVGDIAHGASVPRNMSPSQHDNCEHRADNDKMEASARLKAARIDAGFKTARDAARRHGWNPSTYGAHENGQNAFSPELAAVYARAFKASPQWLLWGQAGAPAATPPAEADILASFQALVKWELERMGLAAAEADTRAAILATTARMHPDLHQLGPEDPLRTRIEGALAPRAENGSRRR